MQILRYLLLFLIFIFSFFIGKYMSKQYIDRLAELEEIKKALNIFKSKIKFTYEPIPEIFEEISNNINCNISKIFVNAIKKMDTDTASIAWQKAIDEYQGNLNQEDRQAIKTLSKLLRNNRYRWTSKPNRDNRKLFRWTNKTSRRRKK